MVGCAKLLDWMVSKKVSMSKRITQVDYDAAFNAGRKRKALERALEIRKFEIELYWKRAAYFWTFIGAAFAGYAAVEASKIEIKSDLTVPLACLGFVFSFGWFCVNKGSKQWQENWENHVDLLEDEEIGPLYRIVLMRDDPQSMKEFIIEGLTGPAPLSVSRINQLISLYVTVIWCFLLVSAVSPPHLKPFALAKYMLEISLAIITCGSFVFLGKTSFEKHSPIALERQTEIVKNEKESST
jgi:hypothetical protein